MGLSRRLGLGFGLSVIGCRLSVVGYRLSVVGCRLSVVGCRLSVVSNPLIYESTGYFFHCSWSCFLVEKRIHFEFPSVMSRMPAISA